MAISARRLVACALCIAVVTLVSQAWAGSTTAANAHAGSPTLFDARADAQKLHDAMAGIGTDEDKIISVIGHRNKQQRIQIASEYKKLFGKDLVDDFKSELTGKFEDLSVALITPLVDFYVKSLHDALHRIGTRESALVDIMCTANNFWLNKITRQYKAKYNVELEDDIKADTSGLFQHILVSLCQARRDETTTVNRMQARRDAQALFDAGEGNIAGTESSVFNQIMTSRSHTQIRQIAQEYATISRKSFLDAIGDEFTGETETALKAIVRTSENLPLFFAKRLHESMEGAGTRDTDLIRTIVTRLEMDMNDIKAEYLTKYLRTLIADIKDDASGDYKHLLVALLEQHFH